MLQLKSVPSMVNFSDEEQKKMYIDFFGLEYLANGEEYIHCD